MTKVLAVMVMFRRGYARGRPRSELTGIKGKLTVAKNSDLTDSYEEWEEDDIHEFEANFMNVGEMHKDHEKEMEKMKEKLKNRIVASKYFREKEPNFLTFMEKEQIQQLHKDDPGFWTPERLSQSFPALPHTIRKVLHSKWAPTSAERVIKYDKIVKENWEKFKAGKLAVSYVLREHLLKNFKHRKVVLADSKVLAEKFVVPPFQPPKPKCTTFSRILDGYLEESSPENKREQSAPKSESQNEIQAQFSKNAIERSEKKDSVQNEIVNTFSRINIQSPDSNKKEVNESQSLVHVSEAGGSFLPKSMSFQKSMDSQRKDTRRYTFESFVQKKYEEVARDSPEEGKVLLDTYRQFKEEQTIELQRKERNVEPQRKNGDIVPQKEEETRVSDSEASSVSWPKRNEPIIEENAQTRVILWKKRPLEPVDYAFPIAIPKNLYKRGMTYRIRDCYYDYDGEFLYRVPGMRN